MADTCFDSMPDLAFVSPLPQASSLILIVDDDPVMRDLLHQVMKQEGYQVIEASDGEAAITQFQQVRPDLVLLDAVMPEMDGFLCCEMLTRLTSKHPVPVLMITGLNDTESVDRAFAVGATDYITKPVHWAVLRQRVRRILHTNQVATELQQQTERERLVGTIAHRIRQSLHLEEILNTAVTEVRSLLQVDRVLIYQFHPDWSGSVVVESVSANYWSLLGEVIRDPCFETNWQRQFEQGHLNAIDDVSTADLLPCYVDLLSSLRVRASLAVPILQGEKLWGLLIAHHCTAPRQWLSWEGDLLRQLSTQLAIAIHQSELYQQVQQFNNELEMLLQERTKELWQRTIELQRAFDFEATLRQTTNHVRDSLDESQILQTVVKELVTALNAGCCNLALYNLEQQTSSVTYEYSESIIGYHGRIVAMATCPELYQQLVEGQSFQFCSLTQHPNRGRVSMFACPITTTQGTIGDLWLISPADRILDDSEINLVQQVANQCTIAIRQSRLYQAAQAQVTELERLNHLKDDFLSTISHELRSPISNMRLAIQMLEQYLGSGKFNIAQSTTQNIAPSSTTPPDYPRSLVYLKILKNECEREIGLINDLLDLQKLETKHQVFDFTMILLEDWIPQVVFPYRERAEQRQQTLHLHLAPNLPPLLSDTASLQRILGELLHNACKYTPPNGAISVTVSATSDTIVLRVTNSGVEIPDTEFSRIFEKFYRIPSSDPWQQGGTGLGLALVKRLVNHLGGQIMVGTGDGQTHFTLELPQSLVVTRTDSQEA